MASTKQIRDRILEGDYPASDLFNDCIDNGEIENLLFDLELEEMVYGDVRRSALLYTAIQYIKDLFPLQYWQYRQLGRGPYQYKIEKGVFVRDQRGLKVLVSPPVRCRIITNLDHERLECIFDELVKRGYIDGGLIREQALKDFLNIFTAYAPQGRITWIKVGEKNEVINKTAFLNFLDLFKVPMEHWNRCAREIANIDYSPQIERKALERKGKVYNELKSIIG